MRAEKAEEEMVLGLGPLTDRWWAPVVRGILAILFGIAAFAVPAASMLGLIVLWAAYALINGVLALVMAARRARDGSRWGWFAFEGITGIGAGVISLVWPAITVVALVAVIAAWAIVTGIAEIAAAIQLRRLIRGEWLLAATGVLSVAIGVLLLIYPVAGAFAIVWMIGAYAIAFGALLVALGIQLRRRRDPSDRPRRPPTRTQPRHDHPPQRPSAPM